MTLQFPSAARVVIPNNERKRLCFGKDMGRTQPQACIPPMEPHAPP